MNSSYLTSTRLPALIKLLSFKYFSNASFYDVHDYNFYMKSLHLPTSTADELQYGNIPGDDGPGDYRKTGVDYVPMEWIANADNIDSWNASAIYYNASTKKYLKYVNDEWVEQSDSQMKQILDDKAYIDMPNHTYFNFLDLRRIFFGITLTFQL